MRKESREKEKRNKHERYLNSKEEVAAEEETKELDFVSDNDLEGLIKERDPSLSVLLVSR